MARTRSKEQELVDIVFACVLMRHDPMFRASFEALDQEQMAAWVAKQLRGCGFETVPMGSSWGVLTDG